MLADFAEQAMLDGIPLGGAGRIMTNRDAKLIGIHQFFLERELPGATARPIAAATVGQDKQLRSVGVKPGAFQTPPLADGFHGKDRSIVGGANDNRASVGLQIVDPIGDGPALGLGTEIMVLDRDGSAAPDPTVIFEFANQFFFLGVHTDDWIAAARELGSLIAEHSKLLIPQGTMVGTKAFTVGVEGVINFLQQTPDGIGTDPQPQLGQLRTDAP